MTQNYYCIYKPYNIKINILYTYSSKGLINIFLSNTKTKLNKIIRTVSKNYNEKRNNKFQKMFDVYFKQKKDLPEMPLDITVTPFQNKVLKNLKKKIKFGYSITYSKLGEKIFKSKNYSRAIGNAMNKNPVPLYFPCHRVIGTDNKLVGFGCGLDIKKALLDFEDISFCHE